jgi:hypothetical protein
VEHRPQFVDGDLAGGVRIGLSDKRPDTAQSEDRPEPSR